MKPLKIDVEMSTATLARMSDLINKAERYRKTHSFLLQVYPGGSAKGLYLPKKEAKMVADFLRPIWKKANGRH